MEIDFHFDENEFRRLAQDVVNEVADEQTRDLELLRQQFTGKPVEQIKPALQRLWASYDGSIDDPELSDFAQLLSDGVRIEFIPEDIRW